MPKAYRAEFSFSTEGNTDNINLGCKSYVTIAGYKVAIDEGNNTLAISFIKGSKTLCSIAYDDLSQLFYKKINISLAVSQAGDIALTSTIADEIKTAEATDSEIEYYGNLALGVTNNYRSVKFDDLLIYSLSGEEIVEVVNNHVIYDVNSYKSE